MQQESITSSVKQVIERLRLPVSFYLAGGTSLAIQLGHRVSEDLDFFNPDPIPQDFLETIEKQLAGFSLAVSVNTEDELSLVADETKLTFLAYPFRVLLPLVPYGRLKLAPVLEIAAMKAYALGRRGTLKDYVDIYFVLLEGISIKEIANTAEKKFGDQLFNTRLFLEQLIYFRDLPEENIRFLRSAVSRQELQGFFEERIKKEFKNLENKG